MEMAEIAWQRLNRQALITPSFQSPVDVVAWNGAVQSQDYAGAKWAVAQRLNKFVSDAEMDQMYNRGEILRTHVMRPTWHFVAPADIRWMLTLTAPRVHAANAYYYRTLGLTPEVFRKSNDIIAKTLEGGKHLTRAEIATALQNAGIEASDLRLTYLVMYAELEGLICSGPRRGKQFTYAILDERVPVTPSLTQEDALAALTKRYFASHGPAQLKDFVWWSGLSVAQSKEGIELLNGWLEHQSIGENSYWSMPFTPAPQKGELPLGHLLPNYDEALASFKDYSAAGDPRFVKLWDSGESLFPNYLAIDGWVVGTWRRTLSKKTVAIETKPFRLLTPAEEKALVAAANRFGEFLGLSVVMQPS